MRISNAFPSQYLKAADLDGRNVRVIMRAVKMEDIGRDKDQKPVLYFEGKEKGLVLNKTNARKIADNYGDDTDAWIGCEIELYEAQVEYQGDTVEAIRVRMPKPNGRSVAAPVAVPNPPAAARPFAPADPDDQDIPFAPW